MIKQNQLYLNVIHMLGDVFLSLISFLIAWYIQFAIRAPGTTHNGFSTYLVPVLLITPLLILLYSFFGLYAAKRVKTLDSELAGLIKTNVLTGLLLVAGLYAIKEVHYSRALILLYLSFNILLSFAFRVCLRTILRAIRKKGFNTKQVVIIGSGHASESLYKRIKNNPHWGYQIHGFFSENAPSFSHSKIAHLGNLAEATKRIEEGDLDEIFIALELSEYASLGHIVSACEKAGVRTQIVPDYLQYIPAKPYIEDLDGLPLINIRHVPLDDILLRTIKRAFDVLFSFSVIVCLSPVLLFCAVMTKCTSPGPIFYKQERVGLNRKPFNMYKFRSMRVQSPNEEKVCWTTKDDPRKTRWGSFMRKTSLDEFPQFFNVLLGHMSVVGPRPERPHFVDQFKEEIPKYMIKHQVRPGITGWAQVNGWRGDTSIEERINCDLYYIENWTLIFDIKIIALTLLKGFIHKNAY